MKTETSDKSVTLIAEDRDDAKTLHETPYTTLREDYKIPQAKELIIDYAGFLNVNRRAQYYLPNGGYTVVDR